MEERKLDETHYLRFVSLPEEEDKKLFSNVRASRGATTGLIIGSTIIAGQLAEGLGSGFYGLIRGYISTSDILPHLPDLIGTKSAGLIFYITISTLIDGFRPTSKIAGKFIKTSLIEVTKLFPKVIKSERIT